MGINERNKRAAKIAAQLNELASEVEYLILHADEGPSMALEQAAKRVGDAARIAARIQGIEHGVD